MAQNAVPDERRVYTDPRFDGMLEVHNFGGTSFVIVEKDVTTGKFHEFDSFVAYEQRGVDTVSEEFARRRAQAYFDRMAKGDMGAEFQSREADPVPVKHLSQRLKSAPDEQGTDPLAGMREMTSQDVDGLVAAARAEKDPVKAEALRKQALSAMAQQESAAYKVVRMLLNL